MGSWWRKYAEQLGVSGGSGSWKRRVAEYLGSTAGVGPWQRHVAELGLVQESGSWERRMTSPGGVGSWMRQKVLGGSDPLQYFKAPFSDRSIWNIGLPSGTTYSDVHNGPYSAVTVYAIGDTVTLSPDDGGEPYAYVKLTAGAGHALPTGAASNANWQWIPIGITSSLTDGGLPRYVGSGSDPVWNVRFNVNAYAGLSGGWSGMTDDAIWSTGVDVFPTAYNTYSTSTADASGTSPTPPVNGTYYAKDGGLIINAPDDIATAGANLDWTIVVFQRETGLMFEAVYAKVLSGNRLIVGSYGLTDPSMYGDGIQNGFRASMIPGYAGCITADEWAVAMASADGSAEEVLPHKLGAIIPRQLLTMIGGPALYPALTADSQVDSSNAYTGKKIVTGQTLQVNPAMLSNGWYSDYYSQSGGKAVRIIARTLVEQGMIALDRGGTGIGIIAEKGLFSDFDYFIDATLRLSLNYLRRAVIDPSEYDSTPL